LPKVLVFPLLSAGLLSQCSTGRSESPFESSGNEETIILMVDNRNASDAKIYIFPAGRRRLLGEVRTRSLDDLSFGWNTVQALVVEVELLVGGRYRLPPLAPVRPGQINLTIAESLRSSVLRY
jgi:hypothetical protein